MHTQNLYVSPDSRMYSQTSTALCVFWLLAGHVPTWSVEAVLGSRGGPALASSSCTKPSSVSWSHPRTTDLPHRADEGR